jgi:hypothetical protein
MSHKLKCISIRDSWNHGKTSKRNGERKKKEKRKLREERREEGS